MLSAPAMPEPKQQRAYTGEEKESRVVVWAVLYPLSCNARHLKNRLLPQILAADCWIWKYGLSILCLYSPYFIIISICVFFRSFLYHKGGYIGRRGEFFALLNSAHYTLQTQTLNSLDYNPMLHWTAMVCPSFAWIFFFEFRIVLGILRSLVKVGPLKG